MALRKTCTAFILVITMGSSVFYTAEKVATTQMHLNRLQAKTNKVQENLDVLAAEWQFLTNPARLEKLAANNFGLAASDTTQLAALSEIPTWQTMENLAIENTTPANKNIMLASVEQTTQATAMPVLMPAPQAVSNLAITNISLATP